MLSIGGFTRNEPIQLVSQLTGLEACQHAEEILAVATVLLFSGITRELCLCTPPVFGPLKTPLSVCVCIQSD